MQGPSTVPIKNPPSGFQQPAVPVDPRSPSQCSPSSPVCVLINDDHPLAYRSVQKFKSKTGPPPHSTSLEDKVAQLTQDLAAKNELNASHQSLLNQIQQAVTCQICLDLMYKPYALAPCGHLACYNCLVQWFTAPPPDNGPAHPAIMRKKTCPHCRAVVRERPIEVWAVKGIANSVGKSGLVPTPVPPPVDLSENANATTDPWNNIFPKAGPGHRRFSWFFPGVDDDDDLPMRDFAPRGEDVGMLDMEDGGIYRCLDCMHEIWDGTCTSCGRVYPGHRHHDDDNDEDEVGWIDDQMGAEEVDMADDPGWMGLEGGDGDDDGMDDDGIGPFRFGEPWEYRMQMLGGPLGFLGTVHFGDEDGEDESDESTSDGDGEGSQDEDSGGYESSFIDDEDDVGMPRIYEIHDDSGGGEVRIWDERSSNVEIHSDEDEVSSVREPARRLRSRAVVVSSDEDGAGSDAPRRRFRRTGGRLLTGALGSDDSEVEFVSGED
ncbi:hypothetical protein F5I97DRAFT_155539 [Phlebopus sp. FC_14]|nr:hypothetical protein F5I97DRAFT_155539 [Phlebopus sp. FC_14]